MRRVLLALGTPLVVFAVGAGALPAQTVYGGGDTRSERKILRALNRAVRQVERDAGCRSTDFSPATFTDDSPSDRLLATLGVLRRPQAANERVSDEDLQFLPVRDVYRGHVRIARSASGRGFFVVPGRDIHYSKPRPARCTTRLRRRFGRLIRGEPARFQRRARRYLGRVIRRDFAPPADKPVEGLFLLVRDRNGRPSSGGNVSVTTLRRRGSFGATARRPGGKNPRSTVFILVPDGVARVTAVYPRVAGRGRGQRPRRYASRVTRSALVRDNVVAFAVPRAIRDSYPLRIVWRAADGRVVKVVRTPN